MVRQRKLKQKRSPEIEEDFVSSYHKQVVEFHPHCFIQPVALADTKKFEKLYALAHAKPKNKE